MQYTLLIRLPPAVAQVNADVPVQWGIFSDAGDLLAGRHTTPLGQLQSAWQSAWQAITSGEAANNAPAAPDEIVVLLSGRLTLHRLLTLTEGQKKHRHTALPYLIEEGLADDLEAMHLGSYLHRSSNTAAVVALPHAVMQDLLAGLAEQELSPDHMYAECQLVKPSPATATLLMDTESQTTLMAWPGQATLLLDDQALPFALAQCQASAQQAAPQDNSTASDQVANDATEHRVANVELMVATDGAASSVANERLAAVKGDLAQAGWPITEQPLPRTLFTWLAGQYFAAKASPELIDLRQGPYRCPKKANRQLRRWRPVMIMLAGWLVLELGLRVGQGFYLSHQADTLWQQSANTYLTAFPDDRQVKEAAVHHRYTFDLQRWLQNRLKSLGKQQSHGEPFLPLLQRISTSATDVGKTVELVSQQLDFNSASGQWLLELQAAHLDAVNQLIAALQAQGLHSKLDSANQEKNGVIARMRITR